VAPHRLGLVEGAALDRFDIFVIIISIAVEIITILNRLLSVFKILRV